jgi:hypothetical protein
LTSLKYDFGMNAAHKWIISGFAIALLLLVLFPPWQQTYKGEQLVYRGKLGHHLLWSRPQPTGEKSWLVNAPAPECEVAVESGAVLRQSGIVVAMTVVLLFSFRKWPTGPFTTRKLIFTSLALALCLPVPSPSVIPLVVFVVLTPITPFTETGHLGPWFVPMVAGKYLAIYFVAVFLLLSSIVWFTRRLAHASLC